MAMLDAGKGGQVIREVIAERANQDKTWGEQNHTPDHWLAILMEEVGEAARASLEKDVEGYEAELIQVAAVAVAMVESMRRNGNM